MKRIPATPGERFGRWTVIGDGTRTSHWLCRCACGREREVSKTRMRRGHSNGCLICHIREISTHHGESTRPGFKGSPEFRAWMFIKQRAGKRAYYANVTVSPRWLGPDGFANFLADMGRMPSPRMEPDRIRSNGNYEPGNVRWATRKQQMRNTRANVLLTYNGRTQCLTDWATELGVPKARLQARKYYGWSDERIITEPLYGRAE
jgi:hypothetical protein